MLTQNIEEMMPIVYTPTVGLGCQLFSHIFRKPRGLFLSLPHKDAIRRILGHPRFDRVEAIVVSDGERILGLGDQGAGGMGIPIGKLSLYTACAGLHPSTTLPILLDVGTDNKERLADPLYVGWQHERVRGPEYDALIEMFVEAVSERWPHVLLHWEDFAIGNANRLLARYRDRLCTFNDDIQGTAAIAVGTLLSAINVTGMPLNGSAWRSSAPARPGTGICALLLRAMIDAGASKPRRTAISIWSTAMACWSKACRACSRSRRRSCNARRASPAGRCNPLPASGLPMSSPTRSRRCSSARPDRRTHSPKRRARDGGRVQRPIIFPLSNPTERSEATPQDLFAWTEGRAVIGTGSPFPPIRRNGQDFRVDQTNNAYVYPGIGLGAIAVKARRISDGMFLAAARAVAELSPARRDPQANLLPPLVDLRKISFHVALAVAKQAMPKGLRTPSRKQASPPPCTARCGSRFTRPMCGCGASPNRRRSSGPTIAVFDRCNRNRRRVSRETHIARSHRERIEPILRNEQSWQITRISRAALWFRTHTNKKSRQFLNCYIVQYIFFLSDTANRYNYLKYL